MSHEVSQFSNEQNSIALNRHNCGSERQIVEQPKAGDWTQELPFPLRNCFTDNRFNGIARVELSNGDLAVHPKALKQLEEAFVKAYAKLDRAEAVNADLLAICREFDCSFFKEGQINIQKINKTRMKAQAAIAKAEKG